MDTYFASAKRSCEDEIKREIETIKHNAVIDGLLNSVSSLLAIVNENREVVAINEEFLKMIGINDPANSLGLRVGEILKCVHAHDEPSGCGTTKYCSSCGAAIAMVTSLEHDISTEKICALKTNLSGKETDLSLSVRSQPIKIENKRFLLLLIKDITMQEKRAALERTFFHDINNVLMSFAGDVRQLSKESANKKTVDKLKLASQRLTQEVSMQNYLMQSGDSEYYLIYNEIKIKTLKEELLNFFAHHPCRDEKRFSISIDDESREITTDVSVLLRVLTNMLINAFEAVEHKGQVSLNVESSEDSIAFKVYNKTFIPEEVQLRVFQRNFSTKSGNGRGCGTYSMKLFGEEILGGKVSFTSSKEQGTCFTFELKAS